MDEKTFAKGLFVKPPHERAPEFVKAILSIKVYEFIPFLEAHASGDGWVNLDIKSAQSSKWYAELNTYKKTDTAIENLEKTVEPKTHNGIEYPKDVINPDDIPF